MTRWIGVGAFVVAGLSALWTVTAAGTPDEPAPLYTNEDLFRLFGPAPPGDEAAPGFDGSAWEFVIDFLDRQYALIDAEKAGRLRRTLVEAEAGALRESGRDRHARAYPFAYYPVAGISRIGGKLHARPPEPVTDRDGRAGPIVPLHARPGGTIVPLHARGALVPPVR